MLNIAAAIFYLLCTSSFEANAASIVTPNNKTAWKSPEIKVCFEQRFQPEISPLQTWSLEFYKFEISSLIAREIGRANIKVTGWQDCGLSDEKSIHINLTLGDLGVPHVQFLGKEIAGVSNGINLSYPREEMSEWYPRSTALHEFMHALGFHHEQERADATSCKDQQSLQGEAIDSLILIGEYDPSSIMNYCIYDQFDPPPSSQEEGLKLDAMLSHLTPSDISALKNLFFSPIAIQNQSGRAIPQEGDLLGIVGIGVESYAYKFIKYEDRCSDSEGYSVFLPQDTPLKFELSGKMQLKLCLLGRNRNQIQSNDSATVYVWPNPDATMLKSSLEIVPYSKEVTLKTGAAKLFKIVENKDLCSQPGKYRVLKDNKIVFSPSSWLKPSLHEGYICLKNDMNEDIEHFIIVKDGISFDIASSDHDKLEIIPNLMGGYYSSFRYAQIKSNENCPVQIHAYSPILSASTTFHILISDGDSLCGIGEDKEFTWTQIEKALKTNLFSDL